jgi:hypothetical protein
MKRKRDIESVHTAREQLRQRRLYFARPKRCEKREYRHIHIIHPYKDVYCLHGYGMNE